MNPIQERLFSLQDIAYRDFIAKLVPTVAPERIIGVRTPQLRRLARELAGTEEASLFLCQLPHRCFEENSLHTLLIEGQKDYSQLIEALNLFLPHVDNWATCDGISPGIFKAHLPELREQCRVWLDSEHVYTIRFGMLMLMKHFLGDRFSPEYPAWVAGIHSEDYYIRMMQAWYFATALALQYDAVLPYLQEGRLERWVHNKTIQKALESNRISPERKQLLRTWKVK